jgi:hypothetical protein
VRPQPAVSKAGSKGGLTGHFTPADFAEILLKAPEGCPVVGGQAVAWWAAKYSVGTASEAPIEPITSVDIDFWGGRDDLHELARRLGRKVVLPHEYEMTVWAGAIPIQIQGQKTVVEFLHTIPGLDTNDPNRASVGQEYVVPSGKRILQFLSPVSLVLAKLHALRHFDQKERQDELHLRASLEASSAFIAQLLSQKAIREVLWNSERLLEAHQLKPNAKLASKHGLDVLSAVPIKKMKQACKDESLAESDRNRISNFCHVRWLRVIAGFRRQRSAGG